MSEKNTYNLLMMEHDVPKFYLTQEETRGFYFYLIEENLHYLVVKNVILTVQDMEEIQICHNKYKTEQKVWIIANSGKVKMVKRDALQQSKVVGEEMTAGLVVIIKSHIGRMIYEFYNMVVKPKFPSFSCFTLEEALIKVSEIRKMNNNV